MFVLFDHPHATQNALPRVVVLTDADDVSAILSHSAVTIDQFQSPLSRTICLYICA